MLLNQDINQTTIGAHSFQYDNKEEAEKHFYDDTYNSGNFGKRRLIEDTDNTFWVQFFMETSS